MKFLNLLKRAPKSNKNHNLKRNTVRIGNQLCTLIGIPDPFSDENGDIFGEADFLNNKIIYANNISPELIEETFLHEVLEVIKHTTSDIDWPEWQMDLIARTVVQVNHQFNLKYVKDSDDE
jgi:hypothetical protein